MYLKWAQVLGKLHSDLLRRPQIKKLISIEPDAAFCSRIREQFPEHDLLQGTVNELKSEFDWNAILSINVLEHIEEDEAELETYHRLLQAARGALCLFVPARPEIYAPIDKDFGHFRRYTRSELREKLERAGFELALFRYYNFVGYFAWWLSFCLLKKRTFDVSSVRFFDKAIFPAVHSFESNICAPPIGQSLIAIAIAR